MPTSERSLPKYRILAVAALNAVTLASCASAVESSKVEDGARREVPVAICVKSAERRSAADAVSALKPEEYWSLVLPSYDASAGTVDSSAADCAGRPVLTSPELMGAEGTRTGPISVKPEDLLQVSGPNDFKLLWLRTHRFATGEAGGPLALARPREGHAEVYAIGVYRGSEKSRFAIERMGPKILVTATDDGCTGVKPGSSCQSNLAVFLMSAGQLSPAARIPLDRVEYGAAAGTNGAAQYRLTATPVFQPKGIRVVEQVVVRDAAQTPIRKSNLERTFKLQDSSRLVASTPSLWEQVAASVTPAAPSAPAPAAPATAQPKASPANDSASRKIRPTL
jgi:hypothetical protein